MANNYQVVEDNGGGLHLFVYSDEGHVIYAHSGYEYKKGQLSRDLAKLDAGADVTAWDGCVEGDLSAYAASYDDATSHVVAHSAWGERVLLISEMGAAAQLEFGVSREQFVVNSFAGDGINGKIYASWADANSAISALYGADWDDVAEPDAEIIQL